jgi:lipopolysaccharide transport system ATP-binding protein
MSDVAIHADGLGKQYQIGRLKRRNEYRTIRDSVVNLCAAPMRKIGGWLRRETSASDADDLIWALRDASFEVKQGEVVGLIGRNGAGKSTLLKILSRITEPTCGYVDLNGRISSLLEVGTGFHHELTGRENIFLNGAILGMRKNEIQRKFDEIVAFSQIERFLDTPVKHYSSGMYVRLAFAVAAHLEPEILLVDEVLAVGDARFQKKCLNKMEDVAHSGRTVVFVSHNMAAVTRICPRAILLDDGRVVGDGPAHQVVSAYLGGGLGTKACREWENDQAPRGEVCRLRAVRVRTRDGRISEAVDIREPIGIEIEFDVTEPGHMLLPAFGLWNDEAILVLAAVDVDPTWRRRPRPVGKYVATGWIPGNFLAEGNMLVDVSIHAIEPLVVQVAARSVVGFQVIDTLDGDSARGDWGPNFPGVVRPMLDWSTHYADAAVETV